MDQTSLPQFSETEEKIFLAALEVFGEHGRDGTRLQEIADRAGINKALVHYYFRSKDRLYEEVFSFIIRRYFTSLADALVESGSFASMLRTFVDRYLELLVQRPQLVRFMIREMSMGAPVFQSKIRSIVGSMESNPLEAFSQTFRAAQVRGEIRDLDPAQTFISILGACIFYVLATPILSAIIPDLAADSGAFTRARKEHVFDLVYNGLRKREEAAGGDVS